MSIHSGGDEIKAIHGIKEVYVGSELVWPPGKYSDNYQREELIYWVSGTAHNPTGGVFDLVPLATDKNFSTALQAGGTLGSGYDINATFEKTLNLLPNEFVKFVEFGVKANVYNDRNFGIDLSLIHI